MVQPINLRKWYAFKQWQDNKHRYTYTQNDNTMKRDGAQKLYTAYVARLDSG